MPLRTILAAASGGTASDGAIEIGCRLARRFSAHVEGFHVRTDPIDLLLASGVGFDMPAYSNWSAQLAKGVAETAERTRLSFEAAAARENISLTTPPREGEASGAWREEKGHASIMVAQRARFFDLAVLGRSERVMDRPHTDAIEEVLARSGRPVLLAPATPPAALGEAIAVGWDGSPEAVRAIAAALPLLKAARSVTLITVGDEQESSGTEMRSHLQRHGIDPQTRQIPLPKGVGRGEQLLASSRDENADLLVMGAYGHRPWREILFGGGATREIIGTSLLPVLLMH